MGAEAAQQTAGPDLYSPEVPQYLKNQLQNEKQGARLRAGS